MASVFPDSEDLSDPWSKWLLHRRHGGDPDYEKIVRLVVNSIRDRVLDQAGLAAGDVLVDVGAGDGLIAFGALDRVGPSLSVTFADVSVPLLERAEQLARERGVSERCRFVRTGAEDLEGIDDETADVVTSRAVLAYVADKPKALRQFYRVLKPGGRISIGEPINRDEAMELAALTRHLESQPENPLTASARLYQRWRAAQLPSTKDGILANPLTNFTERDLISFCRAVGFQQIHLELHINEKPASIRNWETFMNLSPFPNVPSLREILDSEFSLAERQQLEAGLRPLFESKTFYERDAVAYLTAVKATAAGSDDGCG